MFIWGKKFGAFKSKLIKHTLSKTKVGFFPFLFLVFFNMNPTARAIDHDIKTHDITWHQNHLCYISNYITNLLYQLSSLLAFFVKAPCQNRPLSFVQIYSGPLHVTIWWTVEKFLDFIYHFCPIEYGRLI